MRPITPTLIVTYLFLNYLANAQEAKNVELMQSIDPLKSAEYFLDQDPTNKIHLVPADTLLYDHLMVTEGALPAKHNIDSLLQSVGQKYYKTKKNPFIKTKLSLSSDISYDIFSEILMGKKGGFDLATKVADIFIPEKQYKAREITDTPYLRSYELDIKKGKIIRGKEWIHLVSSVFDTVSQKTTDVYIGKGKVGFGPLQIFTGTGVTTLTHWNENGKTRGDLEMFLSPGFLSSLGMKLFHKTVYEYMSDFLTLFFTDYSTIATGIMVDEAPEKIMAAKNVSLEEKDFLLELLENPK